MVIFTKTRETAHRIGSRGVGGVNLILKYNAPRYHGENRFARYVTKIERAKRWAARGIPSDSLPRLILTLFSRPSSSTVYIARQTSRRENRCYKFVHFSARRGRRWGGRRRAHAWTHPCRMLEAKSDRHREPSQGLHYSKGVGVLRSAAPLDTVKLTGPTQPPEPNVTCSSERFRMSSRLPHLHSTRHRLYLFLSPIPFFPILFLFICRCNIT